MLDTMRAFIVAHPIVATALGQLWGAVLIDLMAFSKSKEPGSFFGTFSFSVAGWRYLQALVGGFIGNFAIAAAGTAIALWLVY